MVDMLFTNYCLTAAVDGEHYEGDALPPPPPQECEFAGRGLLLLCVVTPASPGSLNSHILAFFCFFLDLAKQISTLKRW